MAQQRRDTPRHLASPDESLSGIEGISAGRLAAEQGSADLLRAIQRYIERHHPKCGEPRDNAQNPFGDLSEAGA